MSKYFPIDFRNRIRPFAADRPFPYVLVWSLPLIVVSFYAVSVLVMKMQSVY